MSDTTYTELSTTQQISTLLQSNILELSNDVSALEISVDTLSTEHNAAVTYLDEKIDDISAQQKAISAYTVKDNSPISQLSITTECGDEDLYLVSKPSKDTETGYISKKILFRDIKGNIISAAELSLDIDNIKDQIQVVVDQVKKIHLIDSIEISCATGGNAYVISSIVEHSGNLVSCSGYLLSDGIVNYFHTIGPEPSISGYYAPISSDLSIGDTLKLTQIGKKTAGIPSHEYAYSKIDIADRYSIPLNDIISNYASSDSSYEKSLNLYKIQTNKFGQVISTSPITVNVDDLNISTGINSQAIDYISGVVDDLSDSKQDNIMPTEITAAQQTDPFILQTSSGEFKSLEYSKLYDQLKEQFLTFLSYQTRNFLDKTIEECDSNIISNLSFDSMFNDSRMHDMLSTDLSDEYNAYFNSPFLSTTFRLSAIVDKYNHISSYLCSDYVALSSEFINNYNKVLYNSKSFGNTNANMMSSYFRVSIPFPHKALVRLRFKTSTDITKIQRPITLRVCISKNNGLQIDDDYKVPNETLHNLAYYTYIGYFVNNSNPLELKTSISSTYNSTRDNKTYIVNNPYQLNSNQFIVDDNYILHIVVAGPNSTLYKDESDDDPFVNSFYAISSDVETLSGYGPSLATNNSTNISDSKGCIGLSSLLNYLQLKVTPLWDRVE